MFYKFVQTTNLILVKCAPHAVIIFFGQHVYTTKVSFNKFEKNVDFDNKFQVNGSNGFDNIFVLSK